MNTVLHEKSVKTRKAHQCFACLRQFPVGSVMRAQANKSDDHGIYTVYSCDTCDKLMKALDLIDSDEMVYPEGCVAECLSSYQVETPEQLLLTI